MTLASSWILTSRQPHRGSPQDEITLMAVEQVCRALSLDITVQKEATTALVASHVGV